MMPYLQENRLLFVETPLGREKFLLESFTGREAISELFSFQLELISQDARIDFAALLGKRVSFGVVGLDGAAKRHMQGIVTAFSQLPSRLRMARYRAVVSPSIWKLTRKRNSRIFQDKSIPDILKLILQGFEVKYSLQRSYNPREYCVQYRESDFDFVSRLMEEEGIYYFFEHSPSGGDTLVLGDSPAAHPDTPGSSHITYDELEGGHRGEERICDWELTQIYESGKYTLRDDCFWMPHNHLEGQQEILPNVQVGKVQHKIDPDATALEVYDYPGGYGKRYGAGSSSPAADARQSAKTGMQEIEAGLFQINGQSNFHNLIAGYRFALERHFNADGQYVVTSVTHSAREGAVQSGTERAAEPQYSNIFTCIPFAVPYTPPCRSPKTRVDGCQTAYVVGPSGEEIYCDKYGRVKVQFHWDRDGSNNEQSSCWVRVASMWAGTGWGSIHLPRIGHEVLIDFLEGDPDRPIIVGSVYNSANMPPYTLPQERTRSTIKSHSSKGGGTGNFNEIRFDDKKGSEEVFAQAEKDLNVVVKHDRSAKIGHDDAQEVEHDQTIKVGNSRTVTITMNDAATVQGNQDISVMKNHTVNISGDATSLVAGKVSETVATSITITAGGAVTIRSGGGVTIVAPTVKIASPLVQVAGVLRCVTLQAASVVSASYTPGVGNIY